MDAGQTLLENGGEVFRAQQTMEIMAASLGVRDFHVYVLTNGIFASAHLPGRDAVSLVRHVPTVSVHLGRVEAVNELSRELAAGRLGVVEAEARLNTARTLPRSTPQLEILACVVGAAGFAYLFGGTLADMPVVAVAGLLEALVSSSLRGTASTGYSPTLWRRFAARSGPLRCRPSCPPSTPTRRSSAR